MALISSYPKALTRIGGPTYRRGTIWHETGDVILQADTVQFQVHHSTLVNASIFFDGAIFVAQQEKSTCGAQPVLRMTDQAYEWEIMLKHLYNPSLLKPKIGREPVSLEDMSCLLRLGAKYHCIRIRKSVARCLKGQLPDNLSDCNMLYERKYDSHYEEDEWCVGQELEILNVAVDFGMESVLPIAYYLCIISNKMLESFDQFDNLSAESKSILLVGREKIRAETTKYTLEWLMGPKLPCKSCYAHDICEFERKTWGQTIAAKLPARLLYSLDIWQMKSLPKFCSKCTVAIRSGHRAGGEKLWESLPIFFGLPEWKDLKDFMA